MKYLCSVIKSFHSNGFCIQINSRIPRQNFNETTTNLSFWLPMNFRPFIAIHKLRVQSVRWLLHYNLKFTEFGADYDRSFAIASSLCSVGASPSDLCLLGVWFNDRRWNIESIRWLEECQYVIVATLNKLSVSGM